jgi:multidrug efflux pump subunit AcrA (membrane-fusion protein)
MMTLPFQIRRLYVFIAAGVLLFAGLTLFAMHSRSNSEDAARKNATPPVAEPAGAQPIPVETAPAVARPVAASLQATGSFIADETSDVAPQASGQVVATPVDVGAFVTAGMVIARLDDRDARLRLQQAQAAERQAAAAVRQAQERIGLGPNGQFNANEVPEVRAARQNYEAAEAQARLAETNARRYANLVETGDVPRATYDQARTQAETARAQANAARQQLEVAINVARQSNAGVAQAQAALEAARAQSAQVQKALTDTVIKAPFPGYISDRPAAVGEYVTPASKVATLLKTDPIKLRLQLPEADAGRVPVGATVVATVTAYPDRQFTGRVTALDPAIDPVSRTITLEAVMSNPANTLRSNMFATVRLQLPDGGQGVFVPRGALIKDTASASSRVYVIDGDVARLRVVQLGEEAGDLVRVINGVNAGDVVATSNLDQLYDGAPVLRQ